MSTKTNKVFASEGLGVLTFHPMATRPLFDDPLILRPALQTPGNCCKNTQLYDRSNKGAKTMPRRN